MAQISSLCVEIETLSQVLGLVEAFKAFDVDNDGKINVAEPGGILGSLGYKTSEQDVRAMRQQGAQTKMGF
ncbi:unnamed protein product [Prunus armeniaca]|uniref:EF-hand domain-containing protein n=1 Tax=Prunus armeniaca TaxID=36596 RepID=A0A6J5VND4_PRUAR|nr:unnamed protein product [Prunus armeniaca]